MEMRELKIRRNTNEYVKTKSAGRAENIAEEYTKEEKARQENAADHNDPINDFITFSSFKSCIQKKNQYADVDATQPEMDVQLLDINPYSRPGTTIDHVNGIVVHYTANPGSTAQDNRDYFNGLKDSHETSASSNFVIGLEGEIIQCIPTWEMAYASNDRNADTISIECCHPDENGKFTDATYRSLVQLTAWLCAKYDLTADQVIRHYDVTGKICPKYFVEDEDAWVEFRRNVQDALEKQ